MAKILTNFGEELYQDIVGAGATIPSNFRIGLFNDITDTIADTNDLGAITTEPGGTAYTRFAIANPGDITVQKSGGDYEMEFNDATFSVNDATISVDAWFCEATFNSDEGGEGSKTAHLISTGALDQTYDLSSMTQIKITGSGLSIT